MSEPQPQHTEPATESQNPADHSAGSLLVSLAFWTSLVFASLLYAAVSLSPKVAEWLAARDQYTANAQRLHELELDVDYLERVVEAMRRDPGFAQRMADQVNSPVAAMRTITGHSERDEITAAAEAIPPQSPNMPQNSLSPEVRSWILHVATHQKHRTWLLASAAGLTLLAFTLLNESGSAIAWSIACGAVGFVRATVQRYSRLNPPVAEVPVVNSEDTSR